MKKILGVSAHTDASLSEIRGRAINSYALLEQALCRLLITFTGMRPNAAATIFFKIGNARYRNEVLDQLKKQKLKTSYAEFWNSAVKEIGRLDATRNQIVHWHVASKDASPKGYIEQVLRPASFRVARKPNAPELTTGDLIVFMRKAEFIADCLYYFELHVRDPIRLRHDSPWREIFERPLAYPPPPDHPLSPRNREPLDPPRPFRL